MMFARSIGGLLLLAACGPSPFDRWNTGVDPVTVLKTQIKTEPVAATLESPPLDPTITVTYLPGAVAESIGWFPGQRFTATLSFQAPNANVMGYGFSFSDRNKISVVTTSPAALPISGEMQAHFDLPADVCGALPAQCIDFPIDLYVVAFVAEGRGPGAVSRSVRLPLVVVCGHCNGGAGSSDAGVVLDTGAL